MATRGLSLVAAACLLLAGCTPATHPEAATTLPTITEWTASPQPRQDQPAREIEELPEQLPPNLPVDPAIGPGEAAVVKLTVGEQDRRFILSVPEGYSPAQSWPVLMAFPGKGERPESMREYTGFDAAAALVVYAEGVNRSWAPAPYADTSLDQDLAYVEAIFEQVSEQYYVDHERVFATGFSNGGGFAATLGCQLSDTFAGIAPVGAAYYEEVF